MGALGYTHDITLIVKSIMALGIAYNVSFNTSKFQFLQFSSVYNARDTITDVIHNNVFINYTNSASQLILAGYTALNKFTTCFNGINVMFKSALTKVKYHLFKSFCMNLYGSLFGM